MNIILLILQVTINRQRYAFIFNMPNQLLIQSVSLLLVNPAQSFVCDLDIELFEGGVVVTV